MAGNVNVLRERNANRSVFPGMGGQEEEAGPPGFQRRHPSTEGLAMALPCPPPFLLAGVVLV